MKAIELILTLCFCACVIFFSYMDEDEEVIMHPVKYHYSLTHTAMPSFFVPVLFVNDTSSVNTFKIPPEEESLSWRIVEN